MTHKNLLSLLAVPAVAGLLYCTGCERDDRRVDTTPVEPAPTTTDPGTRGDRDLTGDGTTAGARLGGEVDDQQIEQITERIDRARDQAREADPAAPGGEQLEQRFNDLRQAVEQRNWNRVSQTVREMQQMQMPPQVRQEFDGIVTQLRQLNVPELQDLGRNAGMNGMGTQPGAGGDTGTQPPPIPTGGEPGQPAPAGTGGGE